MRNKNVLMRIDVNQRKKGYFVANDFWEERKRCMRETKQKQDLC